MKTFIHHDGALGDVLLSLPCLRRIRQDADFVHLADRSDVAELLRLANLVDEISSPGSSLYASLYMGNPDQRIRKLLAGYDRAYVFTALDDPSVARALSCPVPSVRVIKTLPPPGSSQHVAEFRLEQFGNGRTLNGTPLLEVPERYVNQARDIFASKGYNGNGKRINVLHPGSGGRMKCWPLGNFLDLADRLRGEEDVVVIVLSGPAENEAMKRELKAFATMRRRVLHLPDAPLAVLAALFSLSALMVGNDSGTTHLAAVCGCPVIALFGPTDPELWKPLGANVAVFAGNVSVNAPPRARLNDVHAAALSMLSSEKDPAGRP